MSDKNDILLSGLVTIFRNLCLNENLVNTLFINNKTIISTDGYVRRYYTNTVPIMELSYYRFIPIESAALSTSHIVSKNIYLAY